MDRNQVRESLNSVDRQNLGTALGRPNGSTLMTRTRACAARAAQMTQKGQLVVGLEREEGNDS